MAKKPRPLSLVPEFDPARPRYFAMDYDYNIASAIMLLNKAEVFLTGPLSGGRSFGVGAICEASADSG